MTQLLWVHQRCSMRRWSGVSAVLVCFVMGAYVQRFWCFLRFVLLFVCFSFRKKRTKNLRNIIFWKIRDASQQFLEIISYVTWLSFYVLFACFFFALCRNSSCKEATISGSPSLFFVMTPLSVRTEFKGVGIELNGIWPNVSSTSCKHLLLLQLKTLIRDETHILIETINN